MFFLEIFNFCLKDLFCIFYFLFKLGVIFCDLFELILLFLIIFFHLWVFFFKFFFVLPVFPWHGFQLGFDSLFGGSSVFLKLIWVVGFIGGYFPSLLSAFDSSPLNLANLFYIDWSIFHFLTVFPARFFHFVQITWPRLSRIHEPICFDLSELIFDVRDLWSSPALFSRELSSLRLTAASLQIAFISRLISIFSTLKLFFHDFHTPI